MRARRWREQKRQVQQDWLNAAGTAKARNRRRARRSSNSAEPKRKPGRPCKGERAGSPHKRRAAFKASHPIHVVLRIEKVMGSLRRRGMYQAVRAATITVAAREDFRIVHLSIQRTHVHLLVEAEHRTALTRGMQSFEISAAKRMNAALKWETRRRGRVFTDRYHAEVITSRRQARHALAYVLNNWRKHREDRGQRWNVDPFSSGCSFTGWKAFEGRLWMWKVPETYAPLIVWLPRTWLLSEGWMLYGRIDFDEVPGSRTRPAPRARNAAPATFAPATFAEG